MAQDSSPLDTLYGAKIIEVGGRKVAVKRVPTRYIKEFLGVMRKLAKELNFVDGKPTKDVKDPVVLLQLVEDYFDDAVSMVSNLSSLSVQELMDGDVETVLTVGIEALAHNKDFFVNRVLPLFRSRVQSTGSES